MLRLRHVDLLKLDIEGSEYDVIPDILPIIGYTDDAAMLAAAIRLVAQHITPDHREAARRAIARMRGAA